jgi:hypothetical protein
MRRALSLTLVLTLLPAFAYTQEPSSVPPLNVGTTEWMATAGPALSVTMFHSEPGYRYFLQSLSWGRVLTRPLGPGPFRGQFEWSIELVPLFGQYDPETTYGFGISPVLWRWNFEPRGRIATFTELAAGALWTRDPVPAQTSTANFTAHVSYGVRYFIRPRASVVASYRFHHISNGNRIEHNPGINAHMLQLGVSVLRAR